MTVTTLKSEPTNDCEINSQGSLDDLSAHDDETHHLMDDEAHDSMDMKTQADLGNMDHDQHLFDRNLWKR